jgi:hypothetical protein
MTRTRIALTTAGIIAGALAAQGLVLALWNTGFEIFSFPVPLSQFFGANLVWSLLLALLHYAAFGLGVYLALRFFAPIAATDPWRQTIIRAILVTVSGAVVALALYALVSLIASFTIGAYPFGYSLDAAVNGYKVQYGIQNTIAGALTPLIGWLPLTVLGCVFLRLWLVAHPSALEASAPAGTKGRASVSG